MPLGLLLQHQRLSLPPRRGGRVPRLLVRLFQIFREFRLKLIGLLRVACKFLRNRVVVGSVWFWVWGEVEDIGVILGVFIPGFVGDESAIIVFEPLGVFAGRVYVGVFALWVDEEVLALVDVIAEW